MMRGRILTVATVLLSILSLPSCRTSVAPTPGATLDQWLSALRQRGLAVSLAERIPPDVNGYFAVPAQQVLVNAVRVSAFEYPNADAAAAEAARVSADGQPNPLARISWVSTPRFYRQGSLLVLYVGCTPETVDALDATLGRAFVIGPTPCR